jgi:hypothetical protein
MQWRVLLVGVLGTAMRRFHDGVGLYIPLLLYFASILRPTSIGKSLVLEILKGKATDRRICEWPGSIVLRVLGEKGATDVYNECYQSDELETVQRRWEAAFYEEVVSYDPKSQSRFEKRMQALADTSSPEWKLYELFEAKMRSAEFFLARHEAQSGRDCSMLKRCINTP